MLTNIKLILAAAAMLATIGTVSAVAISDSLGWSGHNAFASVPSPSSAYTCASVHFGMSDSDHTGKAYLGSTNLGSGTSIGEVDNVTMTAYSSSAAYRDPKTAESIKLASGKNAGSFTLTFEETIIGCTVYCIGWKDKSCTVSVNGATKQGVASDSGVTGSSGYANVTYEAHYFDLDETNSVTVSAEKNKQIIVGDVSLRVKVGS